MTPGLLPKLLVLVRQRCTVVAQKSGLPIDDLGWLLDPESPALADLQAERLADPDASVAARAADLDRDIARLKAGWRPAVSDLAQAPIIIARRLHVSTSFDQSDRPTAFQFRGPVLDAEGCPISRGRITSVVVTVDAKAGTWARTLNRFYRLASEGNKGDTSRNSNADRRGGLS